MKVNALRQFIGRLLMTISMAISTVIPIRVDVSESHVLNHDWPAHARLHEVWLLASGAMFGLVALYFIWLFRRDRRLGVIFGGLVLACQLGGFFVAAAAADLYGGLLVDPMTAPKMPGNDLMFGISANLFIFTVGFVILVLGYILARPARTAV
jgi:hypothetical protein